MANSRKKLSEAEQTILLSQVSRVCPLCTKPLYYKVNGRNYKGYDIAHIYPLHPTEPEKILLENEEKLHDDVNDLDNLIPLCKGCHEKFDKPRTVEGYRELFDIKKDLIKRSGQEQLWNRYEIESEICEIIDAIYEDPELEDDSEILFETKEIDEKLNDSIARPTKRKIKSNVRDYYTFIKKRLASLDQSEGYISDLICTQVKSYYLKQKSQGCSQQEIFENISSWIHAKTRPQTTDASEILTSFFIQNCEVF